MLDKRGPTTWLVLVLVIPILAAGPVMAKGSQTSEGVVCGDSPQDPICEIWQPQEIDRIPWDRLINRPLMLVPAWRYDDLIRAAEATEELAVKHAEDLELERTRTAEREAYQAALIEDLRAERNAIEKAYRAGPTWQAWEVVLLTVGVAVLAAGAGVGAGLIVEHNR